MTDNGGYVIYALPRRQVWESHQDRLVHCGDHHSCGRRRRAGSLIVTTRPGVDRSVSQRANDTRRRNFDPEVGLRARPHLLLPAPDGHDVFSRPEAKAAARRGSR